MYQPEMWVCAMLYNVYFVIILSSDRVSVITTVGMLLHFTHYSYTIYNIKLVPPIPPVPPAPPRKHKHIVCRNWLGKILVKIQTVKFNVQSGLKTYCLHHTNKENFGFLVQILMTLLTYLMTCKLPAVVDSYYYIVHLNNVIVPIMVDWYTIMKIAPSISCQNHFNKTGRDRTMN